MKKRGICVPRRTCEFENRENISFEKVDYSRVILYNEGKAKAEDRIWKRKSAKS